MIDHEFQVKENEKVLLEQWIAQGGEYDTHWAFKKPVRDQDWVDRLRNLYTNPIDAFIADGLSDNEIEFDAALARRGVKPVAQILLGLDKQQRALQTKLQGAKGRRNQISRDISIAKKRGEKFDHLSEEVNKLKTLIRDAEQEERALIPELQSVMDALPNLPANDVPDGLDESGNIEVRRVGKPPDFDFVPQDHVCIGEALAMMDFQTARKMSGPRFVVLKDDLARLERALANFMLDLHVDEFGFHETKPPSLVKDDAVYGTGQLPKFSGDLFQTKGGSWLIPTSEVPLTNLVMDQVLKESELPMRRTAYTNCYRSEAGSAGRDTRGMIRLHEFTKVEMVSIAHPDNSDAELEFLSSGGAAVDGDGKPAVGLPDSCEIRFDALDLVFG